MVTLNFQESANRFCFFFIFESKLVVEKLSKFTDKANEKVIQIIHAVEVMSAVNLGTNLNK